MRLFFDFLPILLFFIVYKLYGIYPATATAIVATAVLIAGFWLRFRRVEKAHLLTLAIIVLFGGATLLLQDPTFIKWKPTVAYWLFGLGFLGSQFIGRANFTERMMGQALAAPAAVWTRLNYAWSLFFIAMGALNLYVAYSFSENTWVNFKLFGSLGLTLLFILAQGLYLTRVAEQKAAAAPEEEA